MDAAIRGGTSLARKDIEGLTTLLIDAEMKMFEGLRTPVIFLQNVVVDLLLGLGLQGRVPDLRRPRPAPLRRRARVHHDEPAGAASGARGAGDRESDRLLEHQQDRLPDVRRAGGLRGALRERRFRAIAMSVFASGAIPPQEAIEWVCAQPNIAVDRVRRLERPEHRAHARPCRAPLGAPSLSSLGSDVDDASGRLDRRAISSNCTACTASRRGRRAVSLGHVRHPAEPVAARGRGG